MRVGQGDRRGVGRGLFLKFNKCCALLFFSVAAFGCAAAGPSEEAKDEMAARAAVKPPDPLEQKLARVEVRLDSIDERIRALEGTTKRTEQRLKQLRQTVGKLSTEVASLGELTTLQARESKPKPEEQPSPTPKVEIDPVGLYRTAYEKFMAGRLEDSAADFRLYVQNFPKSDLADNAQYWIGESFFSQKKYEEAAAEFQKVVDLFPDGNKVSDAIYKKGLSYIELDKKELARNEFRLLSSKFPNSRAAALAQEAMDKAEGRAQ